MSWKKTADWYARSLADPAAAHAAWREHGVAVLPLGARFEAVRIPDRSPTRPCRAPTTGSWTSR
ncbi:hypothetical protein ACFWWM_14380 [Streptomyces sp. NPDC058682]|uniref:hypothetical protein n=1 Tax=Streptomyces sp. NPDC058682 TaxID=3346596 RepID=UPI0036462BDB